MAASSSSAEDEVKFYTGILSKQDRAQGSSESGVVVAGC